MQTEKQESFSLKKYSLKKWIMTNGLTQILVASKLGLDIVIFKQMLNERKLFTKEQIFALIDLVGVREAYNIIYFPDRKATKESSSERKEHN